MTLRPDPDPELPDAQRAELALLGHDLRAALSDVIGGLRLIDATTLDTATRAQVDRVRASGEVLARLLEEGLGVMEGAPPARGMPPVLQPGRFLSDLEHRWRGRAMEKGLDFHLIVAPDLPRVLRADRVGLERVLSNLMSNAVKHTDHGSVTCIARIEQGRLCLSVTDSGPGFSPSALARLFSPAGRPVDSTKPGSGLGLHIAKEMADRMGGQLRVQNMPGGGAEVTLCLPLIPGAEEEAPSLDAPDLSNLRLLLAEDSATNQLVIARMLASAGAEVEAVSDGAEAIGRLERETFDAALIDIEMPRLSGLDAIRAIRAAGGPLSQLPIVAVTAYTMRSNRAAIEAAGADAIVSKPVLCPIQLAQVVLAAIAARRPDGAGAPPAAMDSPVLSDPARSARLMQLGGQAAARELLARLSEDLGNCERGLLAGLATADFARIRAETHVLISLAGAVGAGSLQALAERMNAMAHAQDATGLAHSGGAAMLHIDRLIQLVTDTAADMQAGASAGGPGATA